MDEKQKAFFKDLDKKGMCGTTQALLLDLNNGDFTYEKALEFLCKRYKDEKDTLVRDNINLSRNLNELLALARTISNFGGTIKQAQDLSKKVLGQLK